MKIRNGFVSNSSSSSFIIRVSDKYPDVRTVAKLFIDSDSFNDEKKKLYHERLNTIHKNHNVIIDSSYEDTEIQKFDDYILIEASNNATNEVYDNAINPKNIGVINYFGEDADIGYDYSTFKMKYENEMFNLEFNFPYKKLNDYKDDELIPFCKDCFEYFVVFNGIKLCPKCNKESLEKEYNRGIKIEQLKLNIKEK